MKKNSFAGLFVFFFSLALVSCKTNSERYSVPDSEIGSVRELLKEFTSARDTTEANLAKFDTLDFTVFSGQNWKRLAESHSKNVKVNWPDGHSTIGLEKHTADLRAMFVFAPNTTIKQHPSRFGNGNMTCVTGIMTGTFTAPMSLGMGKSIQPTGKSFSLPMCTVATWKQGLITEESIYWDNQSYIDQLGIKE